MRSFTIVFALAASAALSLAAPAASPEPVVARLVSVPKPEGVVAKPAEKRDDCWNENFQYGWLTGHSDCTGNQQELWNRPLFGVCQWDQQTVDYGYGIGRNAC